jgi:hypothetical protein
MLGSDRARVVCSLRSYRWPIYESLDALDAGGGIIGYGCPYFPYRRMVMRSTWFIGVLAASIGIQAACAGMSISAPTMNQQFEEDSDIACSGGYTNCPNTAYTVYVKKGAITENSADGTTSPLTNGTWSKTVPAPPGDWTVDNQGWHVIEVQRAGQTTPDATVNVKIV